MSVPLEGSYQHSKPTNLRGKDGKLYFFNKFHKILLTGVGEDKVVNYHEMGRKQFITGEKKTL